MKVTTTHAHGYGVGDAVYMPVPAPRTKWQRFVDWILRREPGLTPKRFVVLETTDSSMVIEPAIIERKGKK